MADSILDGPIAIRRSDEAHLGSLVSAIERSIDELRMWMDWAAEGAPSPESQRAALQRAAVDFDRDLYWQYSLFEVAGDALVGGCGLYPTASDNCAEISYWVRSDRHGRGYATAAVRCLTSAAFGALPQLNTVEIRMDCANIASARVAEKLGYRLVGTESHEVSAHGHTGRRYVWSATRGAWPTSTPAQR